MAAPGYTLTFDARLEDFETGEPARDPQLLRRLDGTKERHDLAHNVLPGDLPGIELLRARPVLRFDERTAALFLELEFVTAGPVGDRERELLARFWRRQVAGGSGTNYEFEWPQGFEQYQVHFDATPREKVPEVAAVELAPLIARYARLRPDDVRALPSAELGTIRDELAPHADGLLLVATAEARAVYDVYRVARAELQHRAV